MRPFRTCRLPGVLKSAVVQLVLKKNHLMLIYHWSTASPCHSDLQPGGAPGSFVTPGISDSGSS